MKDVIFKLAFLQFLVHVLNIIINVHVNFVIIRTF